MRIDRGTGAAAAGAVLAMLSLFAVTSAAQAQVMAVEVTATVEECPGGTEITVVRGSDVVYCYAVANLGDSATLTNVQVVDDQFGPDPVATIEALPPGAVQTLTATKVFLSHETTSFVTVTARPSLQGQTLPPVVVRDSVSVDIQ